MSVFVGGRGSHAFAPPWSLERAPADLVRAVKFDRCVTDVWRRALLSILFAANLEDILDIGAPKLDVRASNVQIFGLAALNSTSDGYTLVEFGNRGP